MSVLREAGFEVQEVPFDYSAAPGRWGMPLAGVLAALAVVAAAQAGRAGQPGVALVVLVVVAAGIVAVAPRALRDGVARWGIARRRAVNVVGTRGGPAPYLWLVAHVDSKSQPVPMAARVAGVAGSVIAWTLAVGLAAAQLLGARVTPLWGPLAIVAVVAALPVAGSVIGAASPGALDNASGVAAVLLAADGTDIGPALPHEIGVLISSAEEVGLAGARLWGRDERWGRRIVDAQRHGPPLALNVDSVDDVGALRVMAASPLPARIDAALADEPAVRRGRLPPGVLVDAIALADARFAALTVSKATVGSLSRIHTPRDDLDRLRGDGVIEATKLLRRLAARAMDGTPRA